MMVLLDLTELNGYYIYHCTTICQLVAGLVASVAPLGAVSHGARIIIIIIIIIIIMFSD